MPPDGAGRGSIPAYAGEPANVAAALVEITVYPRVCGGTITSFEEQYGSWGLSPRMRGNRTGQWPGYLIWRSIPAYAGEPIPRPQP